MGRLHGGGGGGGGIYTYVRTWGLKRGEGVCSKGGLFSGAYGIFLESSLNEESIGWSFVHFAVTLKCSFV